MRFVSTGGQAPAATLGQALLEGPAPDGGLYVPERLKALTAEQMDQLKSMPLIGIASILGGRLFGAEVPEDELAALVEDALDFPIPLIEIEPDIFCLELFHGPTLAFKDIAARVMARLMSRLVEAGDAAGGPPITVVAATSGDTGSAVAHAFSGVAGFRVCVLYPRGLVTEAQRRLFTTLGGNVTAVAVAGTFDDCQRLARAAFADRALRQLRPLASANSLNVGRLLPQVFYYFHAWAQLPPAPSADSATPLVFSIPSGNFGNLTAGLVARRIGLPVSRFVAATNINDVVPAYLQSGLYAPRASAATISNAMDVGDPSNFARIRHLYSDRGDPLEALRRDLAGRSFDDRTTRRAMRGMQENHGYLMDPHTAVGYLGLKQELDALGGGTGVVLATAHPAKFGDVIREVVGIAPPVPTALERCADLPERIIEIPAVDQALREVLLA